MKRIIRPLDYDETQRLQTIALEKFEADVKHNTGYAADTVAYLAGLTDVSPYWWVSLISGDAEKITEALGFDPFEEEETLEGYDPGALR